MSGNKARYINIGIIWIITVIVYAVLISIFRDLLSDDYCLFGLLKNNPGSFISLNKSDPYFFFSRPLSYFTHWLDFNVFGLSVLWMKYLSLLLLCIFTSVYYLLLEELSVFLKYGKHHTAYLLSSLYVISSVLTVLSVVWISERNQLLMLTFYVLSIYLFLKHLNNDGRNVFLYLSFVSFLLSLLSKQQSVHLPLLLIALVYFYKDRIKKSRLKFISKWLVLFFFVSMAAALYFSFNQRLYTDIILLNLWKKPFFYVSSFLYILFPFLADRVYIFFVEYRHIVTLIAYPLMVLAALLIYYRKIKIPRGALFVLVIYVLSGYPVVFLSIQARLLHPQLLIVSAFLAVYLSGRGKKFPVYFSFILLFVTNLVFSYETAADLRNFAADKKNYVACIEKIWHESGRKKILFLNNNYDYVCYPYEMYYAKYGGFGKLDNVNFAPLSFYSIKCYDYGNFNDSAAFVLRINADTITVTSQKDKYVMSPESILQANNPEFVLSSAVTGNIKSYTGLSVLIPKDFRKEDYVCVFFNGKEWVEVNL